LYESAPNWGHTADAKSIRFRGQGWDIHPETVVVKKNDGTWRKIRATSINPNDSLVLELRDLKSESGKSTFTLYLAGDVRFFIEQQKWEKGIKLYGVAAQVRGKVMATLNCEASSRVTAKNGAPDFVIDVKVTKASVSYDNLKFEHLPGVGGDAAQFVGETAHSALSHWKPSIERDLLAKANASIVKAGHNK